MQIGGDPRGLLAALATIVLTHAVSAVTLTAVVYVKAGRYDEGVLAEAMTSALVAALEVAVPA